MKRVVITGMGTITALGKDVDTLWNNIKAGNCGISKVEKFDTEGYTCKVAAEIRDFDPAEFMDKRAAKRMDRFTQFAVAATKQAMEMSGVKVEEEDENRIGVILGSGIGGIETFEQQAGVLHEKGPGRVSPFFIPMQIPNMAAGQIAIEYGIKGVNHVVVSACASGTDAVGEAFRNIKHGYSDVVITGGAEAPITPLSFAGFCSMKAMSTTEDPSRASIPFSKERNGFVMGEGAGILVLEELEHAKARGANIIAEVTGYGATDDAYHITAPADGGEGAARAMKLAIEESGIAPEAVDYVNAHGTSTEYNDKFETMAIKNVFGTNAYNLAVSSTKSMTGHLLGAAGGIEAIITALALRDGFLPPTIGLQNPSEDLDLDYVPNKGREQEIVYALSNTLGFGGHNAVIALKRYEG